jgi:succinate dehydrogenase/fumarate reductase flavoprotein subunit
MVIGESAAKEAKDIPSSRLEGLADRILQMRKSYEEILNREGVQYANWREAQWAIYQTMYCYALPPNRTENTLMAGYNQLTRLRDQARRILKADNPHDLYHCIEVLNLMDVAELDFLAVNERKESRGLAYRKDYPFADPMLNDKSLVITQKDGLPSLRWEALG